MGIRRIIEGSEVYALWGSCISNINSQTAGSPRGASSTPPREMRIRTSHRSAGHRAASQMFSRHRTPPPSPIPSADPVRQKQGPRPGPGLQCGPRHPPRPSKGRRVKTARGINRHPPHHSPICRPLPDHLRRWRFVGEGFRHGRGEVRRHS